MRHLLAIALLCGTAPCSFSESGPRYQTGLEDLAVTSIDPEAILPGSRMVVTGRSFIGEPWGDPELHLAGTLSTGGASQSVRVQIPVEFVDFEHLEWTVGETLYNQLGAREGDLVGTAKVVVRSAVDGADHESPPIDIHLQFRSELLPTLSSVSNEAIIYVNDDLGVSGADLLLGGDEGTTFAEVSGCFAVFDDLGIPGPCQALAPVNVPVTPSSRFDRTSGSFPFVPEISGIRAGQFEGKVRLRNVHASGQVTASVTLLTDHELAQAKVTSVSPDAASLGQYMAINGSGFVGGKTDQVTLLHLSGQYQSDDPVASVPIDTFLVPEFVDGRLVRYVLSEDDDLGSALQLRAGKGTLSGLIEPIVSFRDDEITGAPLGFQVRMAPVRQVVQIDFSTQYTTSLQHFGLRSVNEVVRERTLDVIKRDFATINLAVSQDRPTDYSIYSVVEIGGPDPNGLGLIGYDNTPGKDVGNLRLHDRIGGVNAQTQADGFPGFGGVFVDSLFVFSEHPGDFAPPSSGQSPMFDDIFDPFRPDRGGTPVTSDEAAGLVLPSSGAGCPAKVRAEQIGCAAWVLGSLIGTTASHELGHSVGLADPGGDDVHILTDKPNRLMEGGAGRPFEERAELVGQGPAVFCDQEYAYLRFILPSDQPADPTPRPSCL